MHIWKVSAETRFNIEDGLEGVEKQDFKDRHKASHIQISICSLFAECLDAAFPRVNSACGYHYEQGQK